MSHFTLILIANGPGEISNLVQPLCKELQANFPFISTYLFLVPCQFATQNEKNVAFSYGGIKAVFESDFTFKFCLGLKKRPFEAEKGAVLYLGGDPFYAKRVGKRYKFPVFGYAETNAQATFKNVFRRSKDFDLMADNRVEIKDSKENLFAKYQLKDKDYALFFASSRNKQFKHLVPFYFETIKTIQKKRPEFSALISTSPFVNSNEIEIFKNNCPPNTHLISATPKELFKISNFLVTIPGTNTAEAMYAEQPMLVVLPLSKPEVLDFPGLIGLLMRIPLLNTILFQVVLCYFRKKIPLFSIPNILHQKMIVPELVGKITPSDLAIFIQKHMDIPSCFIEQQNLFKSNVKKASTVSNQIITQILKKSDES